MKIGILQCGHTPSEVARRHGDFDQMFLRLLDGHGFEFETWNVVDMEFPPSLEAADGWLLTGSRHGAYEDLPFIAPLEEFIRAAHAARAPMVGICFGHQIIAQALGGRVEKFSGGWAIGRTSYALDALGEVALNAWHQDQIIAPPEGARTVGRNGFCAHAALTYGSHIFTLQPHPEFSPPVFADYIAARRDHPAYPAEQMDRAAAQGDASLSDQRIADHIAAFLRAAQAARPSPAQPAPAAKETPDVHP